MMKRGVAVGLLVLAAVLVMVMVYFLRPYRLRGTEVTPPKPAPDFALTDAEGREFRLSDQRGRSVLLFFGYTSCPDVCPTTLAEFKRVRTLLGPQADRVRFVFISVDPERDTPEKMLAYARAFDPSFIGLSGTDEQLAKIWRDYGIVRQKEETGSAGGYFVTHTARSFGVDPAGNLRVSFPFGTDPADIAADVRYLLR
jgi:protein SCO1/2